MGCIPMGLSAPISPILLRGRPISLYVQQHGGVREVLAAAVPPANPTATQNATGTYQCYSSFAQGFGNPVQLGINTFDYAVFAQDNWKVSPRLTIEAAACATTSSLFPTPPLVNAAIPATANHPSDKNNIGPRLGFAL